MDEKPAIGVLYHIFYEDSCDLVCEEMKQIMTFEPVFLFNICSETPGKHRIIKQLKRSFTNCHIISTSNKGKDIGAKLALFELIQQLQLQLDYILLLHDKKSLQALKSSTWKNDLLKIITPDSVSTILQYLSKNPRCGLIATKEYVIKEMFQEDQFTGINGTILSGLIHKYKLAPRDFQFVAGTMFWARLAPFSQFFELHNPLEIRKELEYGNVIDNFSGTTTHSWERMLSWIVSSRNYYIKGI